MSLKNSNWLKAIFLPLARCAMEVGWLYPWVLWLGTWVFPEGNQPPLSPPSVLGILILSTLGSKLLTPQRRDMRWMHLLMAIVGIIVILLVVEGEYLGRLGFIDGYRSFSPKVMALILGAYLWWRGINFGNSQIGFHDMSNHFLIGVLGLVGLLLIALITQNSPDYAAFQSTVGLYVVAFFLVGLLALSITRLELVREGSRQSGLPLALNRQWLGTVFGAVAFIILATLLVAALFSFDLVERLAAPLPIIANWLLYLVELILIPIGYLVAILIFVLRYIITFLKSFATTQPPSPIEFADIDELRRQAGGGLSPETVALLTAIVKGVLIALVAAGVIYLFVRALSRYRQTSNGDEVEEVRESLWSWQEARADLAAFLKHIWHRLFSRFRRHAPMVGAEPPTTGPIYQTSLSVREIYQHLLRIAREMGWPRHPEQTAYEYLSTLRHAIPKGSPEAAIITEAYVQARYSSLPVSAADLVVVKDSWEKFKEVLRAAGSEISRV